MASLETFGLDPVEEGLPDLVVAARHVLAIGVLPFLLRLHLPRLEVRALMIAGSPPFTRPTHPPTRLRRKKPQGRRRMSEM